MRKKSSTRIRRNISFLINFLSKYLDNKGWNIVKFNEMNADRGHDLEAINGKDNLILECRGFPSEYYVNGSRMRYSLALKWLE